MAEARVFDWQEGEQALSIEVPPGMVFSTLSKTLCTAYDTVGGGKSIICPASASQILLLPDGSVKSVIAGQSPQNGSKLRLDSFAEGILTLIDMKAQKAYSLVYNEALEV